MRWDEGTGLAFRQFFLHYFDNAIFFNISYFKGFTSAHLKPVYKENTKAFFNS